MPETTPVTEMGIERQLLAFKNVSTFAKYAAAKVSPRIAEDLQIVCALAETALSTRTPEAAQVEITDAMIEAGVRVLDTRSQDGTFRDDVRRIYADMHDAALAQVRHPLEKEG